MDKSKQFQERAHKLQQFSICQALSYEQLVKTASYLRERKLKEKEILFEEGEAGDCFYFLWKGKIQISQRLTLFSSQKEAIVSDKSLMVLSHESHPAFGEMSILTGGKRTASFTALEHCEFLELSQKDFMSLIQEDTNLGVKILLSLAQSLCHNLEGANHSITKLTTALSLALR